jgi:uncharacterized Zn-finger protein
MTIQTLRASDWERGPEEFADTRVAIDPFEWTETRLRELDEAIEEWDNEGGARSPLMTTAPSLPEKLPGIPEYLNDLGVGTISVGALAFHCIGVSPPDDHPHIYLNIGDDGHILCPYCATRFAFRADLGWHETDPPGCYRGHGDAAPHYRDSASRKHLEVH